MTNAPISILQYDDYRSYLRDSLEDKARKNPAFSLRAFARSTGLSPSHLSRTLSGQKSLSASSAQLISSSLGLSARDTAHLLTLVELEKASLGMNEGRILNRIAKQRRGQPRILSIDTFQAVSQWYHFAILALTNTRGFQSSASWIAQRLSIKTLDARFAVDRLLNLGLLKEKNGTWLAVDGAQITTTDDFRSAAIQENHRQHLELAASALGEIDPALREFNNLTLSMNLSDVPRAKKKIREFVDKFNEDMERNRGQELFQLNVQLYPLTQSEKGQA
jgi:uncharacterized protein (TIGR02147 family)